MRAAPAGPGLSEIDGIAGSVAAVHHTPAGTPRRRDQSAHIAAAVAITITGAVVRIAVILRECDLALPIELPFAKFDNVHILDNAGVWNAVQQTTLGAGDDSIDNALGGTIGNFIPGSRRAFLRSRPDLDRPDLQLPPWTPVVPPRLLPPDEDEPVDMFAAIRAGAVDRPARASWSRTRTDRKIARAAWA